jgi:hypothetical protein
MVRERALKVVLILIGLLFTAGVYPMLVFFSREPALAMMLSLYVTLGILPLLAARNPSANRGLIDFAAWSSFAHAGVMGLQMYRHIVGHVELPGVVVLLIIGIVLVALAPPRQSVERASTSKV